MSPPPPPKIHILNKQNYTHHQLITLPITSNPSDPLPPNTIRIRSKILSLTTNNLTYARLGAFLGWWDPYPLPSSTPAPFNDASTYGRISAWGYAEVLASTAPGVEAGKSVFGYLPIGTLVTDLAVSGTEFRNQIFVTEPHRQHLMAIYNRLNVHDALPESFEQAEEDVREDLGWDALIGVLFGTGFNMNRYAFSWTPEHLVHPSGQSEWAMVDADLKDAVVVVLNASSKTGCCFAQQVRENRPENARPRRVVGVCSHVSEGVVGGTGFYDDVVLNGDVEKWVGEWKAEWEKKGDSVSRIVGFDFGARAGAKESWKSALEALSEDVGVGSQFVSIGSEVKVQSQEELMEGFAKRSGGVLVNANALREKGIEVAGERYFEEFDRVFGDFKKAGAIPGVKLQWSQGMEEWERGWEAVCQDQVRADEALVYWL